MSPSSQSLLTRLSVAVSLFALLMVSLVAASDGDPGTAAAVSTGAPVAVTLSEFAISPATITVPKGGSLALTNGGTTAHNVSITGTSLKTADIAANGTATLDLSSLAPGTYEALCAVPGHQDSGMVASLVVTDGGAPGTPADDGSTHDMAGMDHSAMSSADLSTMEGSDAQAKRINEEMEAAMSGGVQTFLDYAGRYAAGEMKTGNTKLEPTVLGDGTKRFVVTAAITDWEVSPGNVVKAWTYNGQVPGPWIRVEPGDKVELVVQNHLPISTDVHLHGVSVPNAMDGVAPITQDYIEPYESFTYEFTAPEHSELGMYHAHMHGQVAIVNGLFAIFQVGDVPLPSGRTVAGVQVPADLEISQEVPMVLNDAGVIGLSLNGKAFPETAPIAMRKGEWILLHFFNEGLQGHPMHLHRQTQLVVAKDGFALDAPYRADTLWISPGERYSVLVRGDEVGTWAFHCHIVSHAESDEGLTGMVTALIVE
ncbi:MAG: putative multicopper oxidase [Acidimicrobiales bacterium]|nr:putative multicopper oxidase [Acidimicrobiales bacterium]